MANKTAANRVATNKAARKTRISQAVNKEVKANKGAKVSRAAVSKAHKTSPAATKQAKTNSKARTTAVSNRSSKAVAPATRINRDRTSRVSRKNKRGRGAINKTPMAVKANPTSNNAPATSVMARSRARTKTRPETNRLAASVTAPISNRLVIKTQATPMGSRVPTIKTRNRPASAVPKSSRIKVSPA